MILRVQSNIFMRNLRNLFKLDLVGLNRFSMLFTLRTLGREADAITNRPKSAIGGYEINYPKFGLHTIS